MPLTTLSGVITGIRHSTETVGQIGKNGGSVQTGQVLAFRVDDRSARIKLKDMPDVRDDDRVTLAGRVKNGTFHALAMRNDQTRAVFATAAWPGYVMGGIMVALGIPLSLMIIGLPFLVVGIYTLYQAVQYTQAARLLQG
ncbi:hypothetical protein [Hydrogenophaga sp.]|uniref:hypothetical protein n=1 Tax=Hydrogenophaga sp. TaxID=1904254 RepID=UPI00260D0FDB|nr:hypothetical protein [Hydrogenophaga sp.]MCW5654861.1 hypothetical protein [Hydrogenophaga sp.]